MILSLIISKLILASLAIAAAEIIRRSGARPGITYLGWLGALVILITPTPFSISLFGAETPSTEICTTSSCPSDNCPTSPSSSCPQTDSPTTIATNSQTPSTSSATTSKLSLTVALVTIWILGTAIHLLKTWRSNHRMNSLASNASPASNAILQRTRQLASQLNLKSLPQTVIADAQFSPFLCFHPNHQTYIVLPKQLAESTSPTTLDAIILHELTHLQRNDCWKHLFDQLIVAIWWWFPGSWFARTRLREAEENCVDQQVIAQNIVTKKQYATAFLETVDFLSHKEILIPSTKPSFASPNQLESRIHSILQSTPPKKQRLKSVVQFISLIIIVATTLVSFPNLLASQTDSTNSSNQQQQAPARNWLDHTSQDPWTEPNPWFDQMPPNSSPKTPSIRSEYSPQMMMGGCKITQPSN